MLRSLSRRTVTRWSCRTQSSNTERYETKFNVIAPLYTSPLSCLFTPSVFHLSYHSSLHPPSLPSRVGSATLLDGLRTSASILETIKSSIDPALRPPGLAVILSTNSRDSERYVQRKSEVASELGFVSRTIKLDEASVTKETFLQAIDALNRDDAIDGILVQLPLPNHLETYEQEILSAVHTAKDVDGFSRENVAHLTLSASTTKCKATKASPSSSSPSSSSSSSSPCESDSDSVPTLHHVPCTPQACLTLIDHYNIPLSGQHVVVLGRSAAVGLPLTLLLLQRHATVTNIDESFGVEHSRAMCAQADVIITAIGQAEYIRSDWLKPGVAILDVGINFIKKSAPLDGHSALLENPRDAHDGMRLVGDVEFQGATKHAAFITPVPGGVGPMTVAILMKNTFNSWKYRMDQQKKKAQK